jgi:hypothetical protein
MMGEKSSSANSRTDPSELEDAMLQSESTNQEQIGGIRKKMSSTNAKLRLLEAGSDSLPTYNHFDNTSATSSSSSSSSRGKATMGLSFTPASA